MIRYEDSNDGTAKPPKTKRGIEKRHRTRANQKRTIAQLRERIKPEAMGKIPQASPAEADQGQKPEPLSKFVSGNRKAGRPVAPKPWIEAGVSRQTWWRRQK